MDELPRRGFCTLLTASLGTLAGCQSMLRDAPDSTPDRQNATVVVTTRKQLEAAFDELSAGDTIHISGKNAPYRTTTWLDVDVDGVTVSGPGVRNLIKPADGANVGGIRIGHHSRCRGIDVRGVGYHGNTGGQSGDAERLHGIDVRNATNVTIERNRIRNTHPRKHGNGGSGISVSPRCSDVRITSNRISEYGDRGIQLGGKQIVVSGNVVTTGLDRPISCDLWYSRSKNGTAQSVSIFGNLLGDSVEGSLIGIARNTPLTSSAGHVNVFGNVGFGAHKSFCHVRGPRTLENISIQNNRSVQAASGLTTETTTKFAGIAVDVARGRNLSIRNNELHDYSGHGIHVDSELSDVSIQNNSISSAGLAGIRMVRGDCGLVQGNVVTGTETAGIRLKGTSKVVLRDNYLRRIGGVGIVSNGSDSGAGNDISANYVLTGGSSDRSPAIRIGDSECRVCGNTIRRNEGVAIAEDDGAGHNLYADNWADGETPWRVTDATSRVRNNTPPAGAHRDLSTGPESTTLSVEFEKSHARPPRLTFGRGRTEIQGLAYDTDGNGNFTGVEVTVERPDTTVDLFLDDT